MAEVNTEFVHISLSEEEANALYQLLDSALEGVYIPLDPVLDELHDALMP